MQFNFTWSGTAAGTSYVNYDATPTCAECGGAFAQLYQINNAGPLLCLEHAQMRARAIQDEAQKNSLTRRLQIIAGAISVLFEAIPPERRRLLYRALSTVFHPDQGGESDIMAVLNSQRDRYRTKG